MKKVHKTMATTFKTCVSNILYVMVSSHLNVHERSWLLLLLLSSFIYIYIHTYIYHHIVFVSNIKVFKKYFVSIKIIFT